MAVQPDGKIVLAGLAEPSFGAIVRLNSDGSPDRGFGGGDGIVIDRRFRPFTALAIQPDGKIVAGSWEGSERAGRTALLARYLPDGSPDPSFGDHGVVDSNRLSEGGLSPAAILPQPDGRLLVGGSAKGGLDSVTEAGVYLFDQSGAFSEVVGYVPQPKSRNDWTEMSDLLARPDGSLIMAGYAYGWPAPTAPLLARFVPGSGAPFDASFGGGKGLVEPQFFPTKSLVLGERADAIVEDGDDLIVAGVSGGGFMLLRLDREGILDTSFGDGGIAGHGIGPRFGEAIDTAVGADGRIEVVGTIAEETEDGTDHLCRHCREAAVGRFTSDGAFDTSFGGRGLVRVWGGPGEERFGRAEGIEILPDGKTVASAMSVVDRKELVVARYDQDGQLDPSFGNGGVATALPCPGSEAERRHARCLPSARVQLQTAGLSGPTPSLRLLVRSSLPWGKIDTVAIELPPELQSRMRGKLKYTVVADDEREFRHMREGEAFPWGIVAEAFSGPRTMTVIVPPGCLRRVAAVVRGRKLVFRVKVRFNRAGKQTIALRRSP